MGTKASDERKTLLGILSLSWVVFGIQAQVADFELETPSESVAWQVRCKAGASSWTSTGGFGAGLQYMIYCDSERGLCQLSRVETTAVAGPHRLLYRQDNCSIIIRRLPPPRMNLQADAVVQPNPPHCVTIALEHPRTMRSIISSKLSESIERPVKVFRKVGDIVVHPPQAVRHDGDIIRRWL